MFTLTVHFIALAHGIAGNDFIAATAGPVVTKFPTEQACRDAGAIVYAAHAAQVDAALKAAGLGVLQGARFDCKPDGEQI